MLVVGPSRATASSSSSMTMTMTMTMIDGYRRASGRRCKRCVIARGGSEREVVEEDATRRTILGVDAAGTPIRDWDECVEWAKRAKPSAETLGLLDASIFALALPGVAELLLDPVMGAVDTGFIGRLRGERILLQRQPR